MPPKAAKGPIPAITFNPEFCSAFIAVLVNQANSQASYFISKDVETISYTFNDITLTGLENVAAHILPSYNAALLATLLPLCYTAFDLPLVTAELEKIDPENVFYISESPFVQQNLNEFPTLQTAPGPVKAARGQVAVAFKKFLQAQPQDTTPVLQNVGKEVVTRFPPEPSGFLHIGHAKAAILNHFFARKYSGKLHFRLDDTNPAKENPEFVDNIIADLHVLNINFDSMSYTSDHFELFMQKCEFLIKKNLAYADQTVTDIMQKERFDGVESQFRNASIDENLALWEQMKSGTPEGQKTCIRAKCDMASLNKCMRDFVIYRVNVKDAHHRTGRKFSVYPTYDFSCPIIDSIEGITHALRTTEFLDRNEQYQWINRQLGLRCPELQDFSRLRMQYSIMSKRHLQWFVDENKVESWFDPRFPTVQGLMRRGLLVKTIEEFIIGQGASRRLNYQEWSKLWALNKQRLEPISKRFHSVLEGFKEVQLSNIEDTTVELPLHPKNSAIGTYKKQQNSKIFISPLDYEAFEQAEEGKKFTLMGWGNFVKVDGKLKNFLENKDYADTIKFTWVSSLLKVKLVYYGQLVTKAILEENDDFKDFVNPNSKREFGAYVQDNFADYVKVGDILQLERMGFYYVDKIEDNEYVLNYVPEGKAKAQVGAFTFDEE
ncbi:Glutamate-tRNA ligase [Spironucleus salmonicida]|uniref:glutamate--tRNA ligase n=1 Tax=Spironucleus salmonicida TaxID=348837 RepID=V6LYG6_9EUKA|nr:Glutamate-tRNA ligase [Spironucleus salmonicida]|eukprot:EST48756.1 Glutaminyl-tRNA synthetase [Spironucleus salmonicida]